MEKTISKMIKYIRQTAVPPPIARQIRRDFGALVDPFVCHAPVPDLLAGVWMATRETTLCGHVPRGVKETVATAVSQLNQCPYCTDAHSIMLRAAHVDESTPKTQRMMAWAKATRSPDNPILRSPPFAAEDVPEMVGTAVLYHYINRMADIFLAESPLPAHRTPLKSMMAWFAGRFFSRAVRRPKTAGASLSLLPAAELPPDMNWAQSSPVVAEAFGRWTAVVEAAGQQTLSEAVRALVQQHIANWRGNAMPLSRSWVEEAISPLTEADKAAGRLALLATFAPFQVDDKVVAPFRARHPGDAQLVAVTAWASFTAARYVGGWLLPQQ